MVAGDDPQGAEYVNEGALRRAQDDFDAAIIQRTGLLKVTHVDLATAFRRLIIGKDDVFGRQRGAIREFQIGLQG